MDPVLVACDERNSPTAGRIQFVLKWNIAIVLRVVNISLISFFRLHHFYIFLIVRSDSHHCTLK
jgi:hypothetical protein